MALKYDVWVSSESVYMFWVWNCIFCVHCFFLFGLVGFSEPQLKHFIIIIIIVIIIIVFIFSLKHQLVKLRGQIKENVITVRWGEGKLLFFIIFILYVKESESWISKFHCASVVISTVNLWNKQAALKTYWGEEWKLCLSKAKRTNGFLCCPECLNKFKGFFGPISALFWWHWGLRNLCTVAHGFGISQARCNYWPHLLVETHTLWVYE